MARRTKISIVDCFAQLPNPRVERTRDHKLIDIIVKDNRSKLKADEEDFFDCARRDAFAHLDFQYHKTVEKDHGWIETREYWIVAEASFEAKGESDLTANGLTVPL